MRRGDKSWSRNLRSRRTTSTVSRTVTPETVVSRVGLVPWWQRQRLRHGSTERGLEQRRREPIDDHA